MSAESVVRQVETALADPTTGLAAQVAAVSAEQGYTHVSTEHEVIAWPRATTGALGGRIALSIRYLNWILEVHRPFGGVNFDATVPLQVAFETAQADEDSLRETVDAYSRALARVLQGLDLYAATADWTILGLAPGTQIAFEFGDFDENASTTGFICRFSVQERSPL